MTCPYARSVPALASAAALMVSFATGCQTFRPGFSSSNRIPPASPPEQTQRPTLNQAIADAVGGAREDAMLSSIEEFLKRTEDYGHEGQPAESNGPDGPAQAGQREPVRVSLEGADSPATQESQAAAQSAGTMNSAAVANTEVSIAQAPSSRPAPAIPTLESISIRQDATAVSRPPAETESRSNAVNEPLEIGAAEAALNEDGFVKALAEHAKETDDIDAQWRLRLVELALNRITESPAPAGKLSNEAGRILAGVMRVVLAARAAARNPLLDGTEAVRYVDELRNLLADRAEPRIETVELCSKVVTFGVYDKMMREEFVAGRSTSTIVYYEIRNLRSEETRDYQFRTLLATRLEMFTLDGKSVWRREEPEIEDLCRQRRTDFFVAQRIALPPAIPAGEYILKVYAEDKLSGMATEASHQFSIFSPMSIAGSG